MTHWTIRDENPSDTPAIRTVTERAFCDSGLPGDRTEHHVINALRAAGALTVSLVAERDGQIVGHIAFSPVTISDGSTGWFCLGPVSVLPELQRRGIGSALIRQGLERLGSLGARGCVLVGHPDYYPRFGFIHRDGLTYEGVPSEVFFVQSFDGEWPEGTVTDHPAFQVTGPA